MPRRDVRAYLLDVIAACQRWGRRASVYLKLHVVQKVTRPVERGVDPGDAISGAVEVV